MIRLIRQSNGLSVPPSAAAADADTSRERERLRRELLQRIIDRETRRHAARGVPR